ncbi:sensor histidine kinase [Cohnella sp.]|uniref:sensor histidine kinase n=1 Tax=Cohnella sp. TaxID=1883426 RepID=UPI003704D29F
MKYWQRVRLLQKLILVFIFFLIIPVLVIGLYLFSTSLPLVQKENREMLEKVVYQFNENIQYRITGYQNILMQMAFDPRISAALTQKYERLQDEVAALQQMNSLVSRTQAYFPMKRIQFYKTNPTLHEDGGTILNIEKASVKEWYPAMEAEERQFYWHFSRSGPPTFHISKWLVDYLSNEKYGIIDIEVTAGALFDQLSSPLEYSDSWMVVADAEGRALIDARDVRTGENVKELEYLNRAFADKRGWYATKIDGKMNLIVFETNRLGWKIVSVVSQESLWQKLRLVKNAAIVVGILFVGLTLVVLIGFGGRLTKRLNALIRSMRKVRDGDLGLMVKVHGNDELADVEAEFNRMSTQLEESVKEIAAARSATETEKLRLLQAQINPHFLYNTLALVKSMAMDIDSSEISGTVDALAKFFRLALNRGGDILPLSEELEHVQAYLDIHEQRYPGRIAVEFDVEERALSCEMIKITLQPIVENALLHAFESTGGKGKIGIRARLQGENELCIEVMDNGKGMSSEQLNELLLGGGSGLRETGGGFGIFNVNERLKRYFGPSCRMTIDSSIGRGTNVRIVIPQTIELRQSSLNTSLDRG